MSSPSPLDASNNPKKPIGGERFGPKDLAYNTKGYSYDIVSNFPWSLTRLNTAPALRKEVPYIVLKEYRVDEAFIKNQISFYLGNAATAGKNVLTGAANAVTGTATSVANGIANWFGGSVTSNLDISPNSSDPLKPYDNLYKKDPSTETGNIYRFPYFNDINFEVNTSPWEAIDFLGSAASFAGNVTKALVGEKRGSAINTAAATAGSVAGAALAFSSPKVGIADRPRLWSQHAPRSINIKFPLFNTLNATDWIQNRGLCWTLVNQNLFTKLDFISNVPPVFYEILIPGQHFSYAAAVTKLTISNRGNMRTLFDGKGNPCVVPDAYEVDMTLEDLVMPSRNLLWAIQSKQGEVTVSQKDSKTRKKQTTQPPAASPKQPPTSTLPATVDNITLTSPIINYGPTR